MALDEALSGFDRFPAWMWRNTVVRDFLDWLHRYNAGRPEGDERVGFYGLDLYSLHRSMQDVIAYLHTVDREAARRARARYACFDHSTAADGQAYGYAAAFGAGQSCERQVVTQLVDMYAATLDRIRSDGMAAQDELFCARRNAFAVRGATSCGGHSWRSVNGIRSATTSSTTAPEAASCRVCTPKRAGASGGGRRYDKVRSSERSQAHTHSVAVI